MDLRDLAAGFWIDPEITKPYPGQKVLAAYKHVTKGERTLFICYILRYEPYGWVAPDGCYNPPYRWATIMEPKR